MKRALTLTLLVLVLSPLLWAGQETATVVRVVDGDTIKVRYNGQEESLRLIGIDTPESRKNGKAKKDSARSGAFNRTIVELKFRKDNGMRKCAKVS